MFRQRPFRARPGYSACVIHNVTHADNSKILNLPLTAGCDHGELLPKVFRPKALRIEADP